MVVVFCYYYIYYYIVVFSCVMRSAAVGDIVYKILLLAVPQVLSRQNR